MDLERDLFRITAAKDRPAETELIAAVEGAGFKATVEQPGEQAGPPSRSVPSGAMPALVQAALDQAGREGKLVLVDFYADWCVPCKRMLKETFQDPEVVAELAHFVFLKVDTDDHPQVPKHFGVAGIPDVRILKTDGTEVARFRGFKDASEVVETLRAARGASEKGR